MITMMNRSLLVLPLAGIALMLAGAATPAFAHLDPAAHGSFAAGLSHPFTGTDHVLAMVAVGLWAALLGGWALWLVPAAFVAAMGVGFAAALAGFTLPFVEPAVAASVIVIGLFAALALRVPAAVGMALVAAFAIFHGLAHGGELGGAGALPFALGFGVATTILHAGGIGLALGFAALAGRRTGALLSRLAGGAATLGGIWLVMGALA